MNEASLIICATVLLIVGVVAFGVWLWGWYVTRERGPWVVTRVAVGGGREFLYMISGVYDLWSKDPTQALVYADKEWAEIQAGELADVAPLSQYTGVNRG